mmetsp:Transcript_7287/g.10855  ORF Transcript_7287/g.10855 Transcript_7287/m.10855 type:complete len:234 (+) Transcript_7287:73-774(+)
MSGFGELVLILGDMHIPQRASEIPEKFQRMLVPNKMQHVLCTGNLTSKDKYEEIKKLAPNVHIVNGDMDENSFWPETKSLTIGSWKIGLIHGHQIVPWGDTSALSIAQRKLDCDILISGHTHKNEVMAHNGKWFINPGSITGAYSPSISPDSEPLIPSFILLAIQKTKCVTYVYELRDGKVEVSKVEFSKEAASLHQWDFSASEKSFHDSFKASKILLAMNLFSFDWSAHLSG